MFNFKLHKILKANHLTQKQLSQKTGIGESKISYIVNGWEPSDEVKEKIETALNKKVWR